MKIKGRRLFYSLNVYPGRDLEDRISVIREKLPRIRDLVTGNGLDSDPFYLGLWLDHASMTRASEPAGRSRLSGELKNHGFAAVSFNAFPYGEFHGQPVKTGVYQPDWRTPERLNYTKQVADLLADLLPEGEFGSISTLPGGYAAEFQSEAHIQSVADGLLTAAAHLRDLEKRTGRFIGLAVEMEPDCLWESPSAFISFYDQYITKSPDLAPYIGVCYDTCHQEIISARPGQGLQDLRKAGIPVFKIQLSAALKGQGRAGMKALTAEFQDEVYLHQTAVCRSSGRISRHPDLPHALRECRFLEGSDDTEVRVHFHIPVFLDDLGSGLSVAKDELLAVLAYLNENPEFCPHLEIETYTWSVLPENLRQGAMEQGIAKEYQWIMERL